MNFERGTPTAQQAPLQHESTATRNVTAHLSNERTFLAWMRTGLATIAFGFMVERFGLVLRALDAQTRSPVVLSFHVSTLIGVTLTALGVLMFVFALRNFLRVRSAIETQQFRASADYAIVLAVLGSIIGSLLAVYLLFSA